MACDAIWTHQCSFYFYETDEQILRPFINQFVVVYFDDILVYSSSEEDHLRHVKAVLQALRDNQVYANLKKCEFHTNSVTFLGYIVSSQGLQVDESKIEAIISWEPPQSVPEMRRFLGLCGFFRRFIKDFSVIASPLTSLLKKNSKYMWSPKCQQAFDDLKRRLMTAPILALPNFDHTFEVECDASGTGMGAVLLQNGKAIAFHSEKF